MKDNIKSYGEELLEEIPISEDNKVKLLSIYNMFMDDNHSGTSAGYCIGYIKNFLYANTSLEEIEHIMYGQYNYSDDNEGKSMQRMVTDSVLKVVKFFRQYFNDKYFHFYTTLLMKMINFKPFLSIDLSKDWSLEPVGITGNDKNIDLYQHKKCSSIFKEIDKNGNILRIYDIDGFYFKDINDNSYFSCGASKLEIPLGKVFYEPNSVDINVEQVQKFVDVYNEHGYEFNQNVEEFIKLGRIKTE